VEALPEIEAAGARLVVVTPQSATRAAAWSDGLSLGGALVIADPERTLYKALGARRPRPLWVLRPRVVVAGVRAVVAGERVGVARGDDTLQLGADVVVDADGRIAFLHLASDAADRTPPDDLVAVLHRLG
jgi:peroxiredoxin